MTVDAAAHRAQLASTTISGSDWITIDGDRGNIYLGRRETVVTRPEAELAEVATWRSQLHDRQRGIHKQHPRTEESLSIVNPVRERSP
jgi:pyruvate,orthophosphate dikinase